VALRFALAATVFLARGMSTSFAAISHMIKTASVVGLLAYHAMDPPCVA
jgi:hypothetical protein